MILQVVDQRAGAGAALPVPAARLGEVVAGLGRPEWALNLVLVDDAAMAELNERYHGGDGVTDVLSFTYLEPAAGGRGRDAGADDPAEALELPAGEDGDEVPLAGEVVLAPRFIAERCAREGWDLASEWAMLVAHGALHVLGWQHDDADSRRRMREREAGALARAGWSHPLPPETGS